MKRVYQILFNRPLQFEDKVIYGVRVPYDKAKHLLEYAVEWLIAKWCFTQKHGGKITDDFTKWVDRDGNIYGSRSSRQLYAYTAALATQTYFRIDEWLVDDNNCDIESEVEITNPNEYFNTRCVLEEDDYKTGYNGWLQVYQKLVSRYQTLTQICSTHSDMLLDYDEQEMLGEEDLNLQYILN